MYQMLPMFSAGSAHTVHADDTGRSVTAHAYSYLSVVGPRGQERAVLAPRQAVHAAAVAAQRGFQAQGARQRIREQQLPRRLQTGRDRELGGLFAHLSSLTRGKGTS